jgi:hypothetical protein
VDDGKLKMFILFIFLHLFVCRLWPFFVFNFDSVCLLLVGCIFGVVGFARMF